MLVNSRSISKKGDRESVIRLKSAVNCETLNFESTKELLPFLPNHSQAKGHQLVQILSALRLTCNMSVATYPRRSRYFYIIVNIFYMRLENQFRAMRLW